jgi:superfamily II DNA helicase RecQ
MEETLYNLLLEKVTGISKQVSETLSEDGCCYVNEYECSPMSVREDSMERTPEHVLKSVFGYDTFRPMQREIIQNVLDGRDTLAVLPTGAGK